MIVICFPMVLLETDLNKMLLAFRRLRSIVVTAMCVADVSVEPNAFMLEQSGSHAPCLLTILYARTLEEEGIFFGAGTLQTLLLKSGLPLGNHSSYY